jgi:hypothetical protein
LRASFFFIIVDAFSSGSSATLKVAGSGSSAAKAGTAIKVKIIIAVTNKELFITLASTSFV